LKDLLAITSGLQNKDAAAVDRMFARVDAVLKGQPLDRTRFKNKPGVTAEQLYVNQKITDLISKAEMEQSDYRESRHLNAFFGPTKEYFGLRSGILVFNNAVLIVSSLGLFVLLHLILRRQIRSNFI
jgi:hypothetical protein